MTDQSRLEAWLASAASADQVSVVDFSPLSGGAIQENRHLVADVTGGPHAGRLDAVVRMDAPTGVAVSHSRVHEFALFQAAFRAGVTVPEPLWLCEDDRVLGGPFFVMRRVAGWAAGHRLVKDESLGGGRGALLDRLGRELAKIHAMPVDGLDFLTPPQPTPARHGVDTLRGYLDQLGTPRPALEWGLRWLERFEPPPGDVVAVHHDFRVGNLMVDQDSVTGVLDWEFAGLGEPEEDIAWFCAKCWRFGRWDNEAGGLGARSLFYRGYEDQSGRAIDADKVRYYEVMAHVRWAVIALQQADRFLSGGEENLELALTGHVVPELELEVLRMTGTA